MSADAEWTARLSPPPVSTTKGWRAGKGHCLCLVSTMARVGLHQVEGSPGLPGSSHSPAFLQHGEGTTLAGGPQDHCCDVAQP